MMYVSPPRENLLIVRLRSIGDIVLTTAVLEQIHIHYPDIQIHYIAEEGMGEILENNPHVDNLIIYRKGFWDQAKLFWWLVRTKFYMAINLHGGPRSILITILSLARKRVGKKTGSPLCRFYTHYTQHPQEYTGVERKYHSLERTMSAFEQVGFLVGTPEQWKLGLYPCENHKAAAQKVLRDTGVTAPYVVMHGVARGPNEWGIDRKREVAQRLYDSRGVHTVLLGSKTDRAYLEQIAAGLTFVHIVAGKCSLLESASLMKESQGFVGLDSGPGHMAAAIGIPVAVLFGTTRSYLWKPWGETVQVFEKRAPDGEPLDETDPSLGLTLITVDEVVEWLQSKIPLQN